MDHLRGSSTPLLWDCATTMTGGWLSACTGLRFEEKSWDIVRLKFEDEEPRVLRRLSWLGVESKSSVEVRAAVDGRDAGRGFRVSCDFSGCAAAGVASLLENWKLVLAKGPVWRAIVAAFTSSGGNDEKDSRVES